MTKAHLQILSAAFLFSLLAVLTLSLTAAHVDAFNQVFWRLVFNVIIAFLFSTLLFHQTLTPSRQEFQFIAVNSFILCFATLTFTAAIYLGTPAAKAIALNYAYPVPVILLNYLIFKTLPTKKQFLAMLISFISLIPLLKIWQIQAINQFQPGDIIALINAVCYAGLIVWGAKVRQATNINPFKFVSISFLLAIPLIFITGFVLNFIGFPLYHPAVITTFTPTVWLSFVAISLLGSTVPTALIYFAINKLKPLTASILLLTEPVFVYLLSLVFFHQQLDVASLLGMFGIILAVILT